MKKPPYLGYESIPEHLFPLHTPGQENVYDATLVGQEDAGRTIANPELGPDLTSLEHEVLVLASLGGTTREVAGLLSQDEEVIKETRDSINNKFGAKTMAASVSKAIKTRQLPIEITGEGKTVLPPNQQKTLGLIAEGWENIEIADFFDKKLSTFVSNIFRPLQKTLLASGRTHSVRRAYELGIFKIPNTE